MVSRGSLSPVVTRFAPSPTGFLHLGHVANALYVWGLASALRGRVLLRVDDHDRQRCRPAFETAILDDLAWLGFIADGPPVRQSGRGALYEAALDALRGRGLVYACECSRAEIGAARYPGTCRGRHLAEAPGAGLRVRLEDEVVRFDDWRLGPQAQRPHEQCGDMLVRDRDGNWTYQFATVVDDWRQRVSLVIRGEDLVESTGRQIQLARLLGRLDLPAFLHHPLVMKNAARKLSKADRDTGIRDLRADGWSADRAIGHAAWLVGLLEAARPLAADRVGTLFQNFVRATRSS